jgi:hypothetical protein
VPVICDFAGVQSSFAGQSRGYGACNVANADLPCKSARIVCSPVQSRMQSSMSSVTLRDSTTPQGKSDGNLRCRRTSRRELYLD